ncbi:transglutaminase family protein [Sphingomonas sanxanigenens]|uniref:Transglutaminase-like domain-containing protein n=1 Tax=Sphingomonas sanxanigenens DSM 19645 = NX02 TaxID=1123269 RepID=W0AGR4_9SPHN|nr:transglutaminase family protein [Sphingomonas sanxanigenens]AHE57079.1 hypothetical protein NX02_27465 [Sphingomonas sanxanigenens DSM 19645 = NX02]
MLYDITHTTRFDYDVPVLFARCNLRLKPIAWAGQRLLDYDLSVEPGGELHTARAGAVLANVTRMVVPQAVDRIEIVSRALMEVDRPAQAPDPEDPTVAEIARAARLDPELGPEGPANYLFPTPLIPHDRAITDWCAETLRPDRPIREAAFALAVRIRKSFKFDPKATMVETRPAEAFAKRGGVCQDFAQIMITGMRGLGLPAAYVSGFIRTIPPPGKERLVGADATHAWVLVWCGPEVGWVGVDPTNGIWMANDHIVTAIGRDYAEIAPVDGIFLGSGAQHMDVSVDVAPKQMVAVSR